MNYDFAIVMMVILALVIIGKPDVLREVTKMVKEFVSIFSGGKK